MPDAYLLGRLAEAGPEWQHTVKCLCHRKPHCREAAIEVQPATVIGDRIDLQRLRWEDGRCLQIEAPMVSSFGRVSTETGNRGLWVRAL